MKLNKINKIFGIMCVLLLLIVSSFGAETSSSLVRLKFLNQNPDPVKAGDEVVVRVAIENLGTEDLNDYYVEFVDSYPFTLFKGETRNVFVGTVLGNAKDDSAQIVKFKLKVDEDISEGNYPIKINAYQQGKKPMQKEFLVEISSEANAEISTISVDTLVPGEKTKISFGIKNVGQSDLENVKFSWDSQDDIILPVGSGNFKYIDRIKVGEEYKVDFNIVSDLNTEPKLYKLDLTLEYDDVESLQKITDAGTIKNEKRREVKSKAGIYVGGKTNFDISFKEFRKGETTFSITNIGSNLADSVVVKVTNPDNWKLEGSDSDVVGKIKKGAFGRANLKIKPQSDGEQKLDLLVEYTDTTGQRQQFNKTLTLDSSLFEDSISLINNDNNGDSKSSSNLYLYGGLGFVLVLAFFGYRKRKASRRKNK